MQAHGLYKYVPQSRQIKSHSILWQYTAAIEIVFDDTFLQSIVTTIRSQVYLYFTI